MNLRTIVSYTGDSGRIYDVIGVLHTNTRHPDRNILLARSEHKNFVIKPVSRPILDHTLEMQRAFAESKLIRLPIDWIQDRQILILRHYTDDLFSFVRRSQDLEHHHRIDILWRVLKGLQELHDKQWIHADLIADNIMIMWDQNSLGEIRIKEVVISDTDCATRLLEGRLVYTRVGNPMWRAPEAQVGVRVGLKSDVYSFGILCHFCLLGDVPFLIDLEQLNREGIEPEMEVLFDTAVHLGDFPEALLEYIREDRVWYDRLKAINHALSDGYPRPADRLAKVDPDARKLIAKALQLDPAKRPTVAQLMQDRWWEARRLSD